MQFKPFGNYILAKRVEITETEGGIHLPTAAKTKIADVVAVGPGVADCALLGSRVLFSHNLPITINKEEYLILTEKDILGTFCKEE